MKKNLTLTATLASLVALFVLASCQKEEDGKVYFTASIEEASAQGKTAIGQTGSMTWENGDQIAVYDEGGTTASVLLAHPNNTGNKADFTLVPGSSQPGSGPYYAIYPAEIATGYNTVTLPAVQSCSGNHLAAPMYAYSANNKLTFKNLCGVLKLTVTASQPIRSIVLKTPGKALTGSFDLTYAATGPTIAAASATTGSMVTLDCGEGGVVCSSSTDFYIYLPPATYSSMAITFQATDGTSCTKTLTGEAITVNRNELCPIPFGALTLSYAPAQLVDGLTFKDAIPSTATSVVFDSNSTVSSGTPLHVPGTPTPIYGNLVGTVWTVSTPASQIMANPDCAGMFAFKRNLQQIDFGRGFNTENVETTESMFYDCSGLASLDVTHFNTAKDTNMCSMFQGCSGLENLDVTHFNTAKVTNMSCMFQGCSGLENLDVTHFNTARVTEMSYMFESCRGLTSLNLSNFNTVQVTNMDNMFYDCTSLESITFGTNFNTEQVTRMGQMFSACSALRYLDLSGFNTANVEDMYGMFDGCYQLQTLRLDNFVITSGTDTNRFCYSCGMVVGGGCTIYCTEATETAIRNSSGFEGNFIHFARP